MSPFPAEYTNQTRQQQTKKPKEDEMPLVQTPKISHRLHYMLRHNV
jgi:hypothetical protein